MANGHLTARKKGPLGLYWRCSVWFVTLVVSFGVATDLLVYSLIVPVLPFQLEYLGYSGVSGLVGWLLLSFSAGLVISTIPIAMVSERYGVRRILLVIGSMILIGSQVMLMEAPTYWLMCIARILQGIGSSMVWVSGLALLCDTTPEHIIGRQLGISMSLIQVGYLVGPPVGGSLYRRFGFRGPFIFGIITAFIDLVGRLLVIERGTALKWGVDPKEPQLHEDGTSLSDDKPDGSKEADVAASASPVKTLSLIAVVIRLSRSRRALTVFLITLIYGLVFTSVEPTLPLHLQQTWGLGSAKTGIVFMAAVVPVVISSPLAGWLSDRFGAEYVAVISLVMAVPWWIIMGIRGPLALFIVAFIFESLFTSGALAPVAAELAAVSRDIQGIGYAHVYGAFNLAFGIGNSVGPVIGGQLYDHVRHGWMTVCLVSAGMLGVSILLAFSFTGKDALLQKSIRRFV